MAATIDRDTPLNEPVILDEKASLEIIEDLSRRPTDEQVAALRAADRAFKATYSSRPANDLFS